MNKNKQVDFTEFQHKPLKFMFFVARQNKWLGIISIFFVILAGSFQAFTFPLIKDITNSISEFNGNIFAIYSLVVSLIIILIFKNLFYRASGFFASTWVSSMEMFSAQVAFDYIMGHSARYFVNRLSGKLQNKIFNVANAIIAIFPILLWNFLTLIIKLIVLLVLSFSIHITIGFISVLFIFISIIYSLITSRKLAIYSKKRSEKGSEVKGVMVDIIGNILATKQNIALKKESKNVHDVLDKHRKAHLRGWRYADTVLLFNNLIIITMIAGVIFSALYFWQQGAVNVGEVIMLITILLMLYGDLEFLSMSFSRFMENYGQMKEGLEEVFASHEIIDDKNAKKVEIKNGEILFNKVDFHYEEDETQSVFEKLSLKIPAGQKIGLVGESGAGKSTFVSLLLRFMDVESGAIKIDEHNIRKIKQDDLRSSIAYVPQEALLFHRSLAENIKYSYDKATDDDMFQAAKRAHALKFINNFPEKFKTLVGERGVKLSGGQKQRVMIARAMLKKSPILVLDEATSSLDSNAERFIQEALGELMRGRTTIVIAHRLSTLKKMDRIVVFEGGRIIEDGSHKELLAKRGKYFELWQHQIN